MNIAALLHRGASVVRLALIDASLLVIVGFLALLAWAWRLT